MKRLTARFNGRVQGVGFRFTTVDISRRFAITGYVQNMPNRSVELVAEGEVSEVRRFLDALQISPVFSHVIDHSADWSAATGEFASFSVRY